MPLVRSTPIRAPRAYPKVRTGPGGGTVAPGGGGGQQPVTAGGLTQPPAFTYDPAIEAQRRAAHRGMLDTIQDTNREKHYAERDLGQALRDVRVTTTRKRQDTLRSTERAQRQLDYKQQDTERDAARAEEDFRSKLSDIGRQFAQLGQRQREGQNVAGTNDAATEQAAGNVRAGNQRLAEAPILTARQRLGEDLSTALGRIETGRGDISADEQRSLNRMNQDRDRERRLARQKEGRTVREQNVTAQRARREGAISNIDLITQEIYQARQNRPGAFSKTGNRRKR